MRRAAALTLATTIGILMLASGAQARSEFCGYLPNGGANCENCHPGGNTATVNAFGQSAIDNGLCDASGNLIKPGADWWGILVDLDADGDQQTNGEELGDPCGDWTIGATPGRTTDISNPGDPASVSPNPDTPPCGGTGGAGGTGAGTGAGPATSTGAGGPTTGATTGGGPTSGGQGGAGQSTGAGKADPPVVTAGSCSTTPSPVSPAGAFAFLAAAGLVLARSRRNSSK